MREQPITQVLAKLETIAATADIPFPHWLGGDSADQGPSYCRECAEKEVAAGNAEYVDGGWNQDHDGCCHCEGCGRLLDYTLTNHGVGDELDYFKGDRLRGAMTPEVAYHLARLLEHHREHPEVLAILPKVQRNLARSTPEERDDG